MKDSHYRISLDIHSTQSQVSLPVKQGDTSRKVFISLCEGGNPYQIDEDCLAVFSARKPDGNIIENNCIIANNVIEYTITEQTSAASGMLNCELKLYGGNSGLITSPRFTVIVDSRAVSDEEIESTSEYSALTKLIDDTTKATSDANAAADIAKEKGDYAQTQGDYAKSKGDAADTATSNANSAATQATTASTNANNAAASATMQANAAATAASNAETQANNARSATDLANAAASNANVVAEEIHSVAANALKGTASGTALTLTDVSPLEHEMKVKLSDPSATLTVCGKNLLDLTSIIGEMRTATGGTITCGADGGITGSGTPNGYVSLPNVILKLPRGKYVISKSGTSQNIACGCMVRDSENNPLLSVTIDELVPNRFLDLNAYPNYDNIYIEFKRGTPNVEMSGTAYFQIEEGTTATAYEPFAEATTHTPNADGTVEGVTSLYPTTILTTDTEGVTIDVEYNRDINILTKAVPLHDRITGIPYYLYVSGGKLLIEEREV